MQIYVQYLITGQSWWYHCSQWWQRQVSFGQFLPMLISVFFFSFENWAMICPDRHGVCDLKFHTFVGISVSPELSNLLTIPLINFSTLSESTFLFLRAVSIELASLSLLKTALFPSFLITVKSLSCTLSKEVSGTSSNL